MKHPPVTAFVLENGRQFVPDEWIVAHPKTAKVIRDFPECFEPAPWGMDGVFIKEEYTKP